MKRMEPSGTDCHHYLAPYDPGDPGATLSNSVLKSKNSQMQTDHVTVKQGRLFCFLVSTVCDHSGLLWCQRKASVRVFRDSVSKGRDKKDKQTLQAFLGADIHNTKESTPSAASSNVNIKFGEMLTNMWNLYFKASGLLWWNWDIYTLVKSKVKTPEWFCVVDRPTQLVCIWIFICCQQTNISDIPR